MLIVVILSISVAIINTFLTIKLLRERDSDREQSVQAIRNQYKTFTKAKEELLDHADQEYLRGKQMGKRAILRMIREKIDNGELKVVVKK